MGIQRYDLIILGGDVASLEAADYAERRGCRVALILPEDPLQPEATEPSEEPPTADGKTRDRSAATPEDSPSAAREAERSRFQRDIRARQARLGLRLPPVDACTFSPRVDVFRGQPAFYRHHTLVVGDRELAFRRAVIATGQTPGEIPLPGAQAVDCLRPETLDTLEQWPSRLAVIGTDGEACFWAQTLRRFGCEVYLTGCADQLASRDAEAAHLLHDQLAADGVRLQIGCTKIALEPMGHLTGVILKRANEVEKLLVDRALVVGHRRPRLDGLALRTAAVNSTDNGVGVDGKLRTSGRHVYAAGACCGSALAPRPAAEASARLAVRNALSLLPRRLDETIIPHYAPTEPMFVQLGLSAEEIRERELQTRRFRIDLDEADEGVPVAHRRGFVAVDVLRRGGRIVGVTAVAHDADELVAPLELLMMRGRTLGPLSRMVCCRPSRMALLARLAEQWSG